MTAEPFPTYPNGFPPDVVEAFAAIAGKTPFGNVTASGTEIIEQLGPEHLAHRAAHPLYIGRFGLPDRGARGGRALMRLYDWCEKAREMLTGPHRSTASSRGRSWENRGLLTGRRIGETMRSSRPRICLTNFELGNIDVYAVGKIGDIYCGRSITATARVADNQRGDGENGRVAQSRR